MVAHSGKPSTQEVEAGGSEVLSLLGYTASSRPGLYENTFKSKIQNQKTKPLRVLGDPSPCQARARTCQMMSSSFRLMPAMLSSFQPLYPENLAQNEPRKKEKAWPVTTNPTEPSLTEEQRPLSRGALLFWFPGRRQPLTQEQRGCAASVQPTHPGARCRSPKPV